MHDAITDVAGILVGHDSDESAATGCTVVLAPQGVRAGVVVRGGAPASREIALLEPGRLVDTVHAIVLSGGSAFGLAAADGAVRWLEERGHGIDAGVARVPIVPAACLFDLGIGDPGVRPDAESGYRACSAATDGPVAMGNVGAGTGATVGKVLGQARAMKGGLGSASRVMAGQVRVGALVVVNALGDVVDHTTGRIVAGAREADGSGFADAVRVLTDGRARPPLGSTNTTLGVVATDAAFSKAELAMLAEMAHDGLARSIRPAHTLVDGDTVFALSTGNRNASLTAVGAVAAEVLADAVVRAVRAVSSLHGIPAAASSRE